LAIWTPPNRKFRANAVAGRLHPYIASVSVSLLPGGLCQNNVDLSHPTVEKGFSFRPSATSATNPIRHGSPQNISVLLLSTTMTPDEKPEPSTGSGTVEHQMTTPLMTHDFGFVPIPRRLRYDPQKPFHFGLVLNVLFGFASTFIVANLYYCQVRVGINPQLYSSNDATGFQPLLSQLGYIGSIYLLNPRTCSPIL
jgi:hypothetical protein